MIIKILSMKKLITLCLSILTITVSFAQNATITNSLNAKLNEISSNDYLKVNVVFTDQVNHLYLNQQFKENNTPLNI